MNDLLALKVKLHQLRVKFLKPQKLLQRLLKMHQANAQTVARAVVAVIVEIVVHAATGTKVVNVHRVNHNWSHHPNLHSNWKFQR